MRKSKWIVVKKNILVTGSSRGIGFYTALGLAEKGGHVIIVSHDEEHSKAAVKKITEKFGENCARYYVADLSSLDQVRGFAEKIKQDYDQLDVLINNVGAWFSRYKEGDTALRRPLPSTT